ncbi:hypothetical protein D9619_012152 [Psilocybe cf. subviscida]|uniref:Uncharacterized protein n=1 Tax=Psilocybe cf. subviscida TaxID=2480587 RepID=A0A8H5EZL1_9AGAR|nr:hypothetical protein D9619_012152 [Psilocybe cf. subviscida]
MPGLQQHGHVNEYADPVLRPPSPASSVGTAYEPDQTSHSDSEFQLSQPAFERKVKEKIELDRPRPEELEADKDPLIMVEGANGQPVWVNSKKLEPEEEKRLYTQAMHNLRLEVAKLREDEIFDQILLRGSRAALEVQPSTDDIDELMRSMMGTGLTTGTGPHLGKVAAPPPPAKAIATTGPGITNGPWNNFGQPPESERRDLSMDNMLSGTTVGKRSSRKSSSRRVL